MNTKNAISRIMFNVFASISAIGFLILGCITDVGAEGFRGYIYMVVGWFICMTIVALFYDYRIIVRHIYAFFCTCILIYAYITKRREPQYIELYKVAIDAGSIYDFYLVMLDLYDISHQRKDDI